MNWYEFPVLSRREFTPALASNVLPFYSTFISGIDPADLDSWVKPSISIVRERIEWMDDQEFTFSVHVEVEDCRDPAEPDRPFYMMGMYGFERPTFVPEWVIHYKLTFNHEAAPMAYAMRWRGVA